MGIRVTFSPIFSVARLVQPLKTGVPIVPEYPIVVQLVALKLTEVRPLQPLKAAGPMLLTELGMVTEVRPLQPEKA